MTKNNLYTIFGAKGFFGTNLKKYLIVSKKKIFLPPKKKYIFKKNLGNVIFCIGTHEALKKPNKALESNLAVLSKVLLNNKFKTFTYLSSIRTYSTNKIGIENKKILFDSKEEGVFFKALKLSAESLCLQIKNPKIKVIRLSNLFGDNFNNHKYLLPTLIRNSLFSKKVQIVIHKNSKKNYLHVDDAIKIRLSIINKGKERIYNVGSNKSISVGQIAKLIKKYTGCKIVFKKNAKVKNEPIINISRIKKEFNFYPKKMFENEIKMIIKNYKNEYN